jgi:hypothetical protein
MRSLTLKRRPSKKERALNTAGKVGSAVALYLKARIAWLAGKKAAKVAAPALAAGTAAVVVKKRRSAAAS